MMISYDDLKEIPLEMVIEADDEMKFMESEYNPYRSIIKHYKTFEEAGLTPLIYLDVSSSKFYITTKERQEGTLH